VSGCGECAGLLAAEAGRSFGDGWRSPVTSAQSDGDALAAAAGESWYHGWVKRNGAVSLRRTHLVHDALPDRGTLDRFYAGLWAVIDEMKITADCVFNMDESGTVPARRSLPRPSARSVWSLTRGSLARAQVSTNSAAAAFASSPTSAGRR
jgi:hypothetical protein